MCFLMAGMLTSFSLNLTQPGVILEERDSIEKNALPDWPVGKPVVCFVD